MFGCAVFVDIGVNSQFGQGPDLRGRLDGTTENDDRNARSSASERPNGLSLCRIDSKIQEQEVDRPGGFTQLANQLIGAPHANGPVTRTLESGRKALADVIIGGRDDDRPRCASGLNQFVRPADKPLEW